MAAYYISAVSVYVSCVLGAPSPPLPPAHTKVCHGRTCRPGEGNPTVTHNENPYEFPVSSDAMRKGLAHEPDPASPQYAPLVSAAKAIAHSHHRLIIFCVADFDYREIAENWFRAIKRAGLTNALVYALDVEAHAYFGTRGVQSFDGSKNLDEWSNATRFQRHVQQADAEKHVAAAAMAAGGLDVLLLDATHVVLGDVMPHIEATVKAGAVDGAMARGGCNGKPPVGCGPLWNLVYLRGAGTSEQRARAVSWQIAGVRKGLVDFYLRWWNGAVK